MTHTLAKPKTATDSVVSLFISSDNTENDNTFVLKPANISMGFKVNTQDVTGDDDVDATYTHNEMSAGNFSVSGYALGPPLIKIASLQSTANGGSPGGSRLANIQFNWASGHYVFGTAILSDISLSFTRSSPYVGVSLRGMFTETELGTITYVDNTTGDMPTP